MPKLLVLAVDGQMDSSLALTLDALSTANRLVGAKADRSGISTTLFSPGRRSVRTGQGARYAVQGRVRLDRYDALVVPGLGLSTPKEIDAFFRRDANRRLVAWLRDRADRLPPLAAGCSAVFLLAEAGLLQGRRVTTTWWLGPLFRERFPRVDLDETRMLVDEGGVLTAGAALAQIDLVLHLIARLGGVGLSRDVARYLAIEGRPTQARYMMLSSVAGRGEDLARIERWIRRHRAEAFKIPELARSLGMSPRTLDRRVRDATGHGVARFAQRIRLEYAAHLLETTSRPVDAIAGEVGYADANTLRRLLKRHLGASPSALRRAAG